MIAMLRIELRLAIRGAVLAAAAITAFAALWSFAKGDLADTDIHASLVQVFVLALFGLTEGRRVSDAAHVPILLGRTHDPVGFVLARVGAVSLLAFVVAASMDALAYAVTSFAGGVPRLPVDDPFVSSWMAGIVAAVACVFGRGAGAVVAGALILTAGAVAPPFYAPWWYATLVTALLGPEPPEFLPSFGESFAGAFHASVTGAYLMARLTHLVLVTTVLAWIGRRRDVR